MDQKIFYLGYYDVDEFKSENRYYSLAARNKMKYIASVLCEIGKKITIISPSFTNNNKKECKRKLKLNDKIDLVVFTSFGKKNILNKVLDKFLLPTQLFAYILFNIKSNDILIVYHSLNYMYIIKFLKKLLKFHFILEFEEIYGDVITNNKIAKKELEYTKSADAFIFPTELLNKKINVYKKPYTIIHGIYQLEGKKNKIFFDNKIHIVYSGTLDIRKGCKNAVHLSKYLPSNYCVHILGFGTKEEKEWLRKEIEKVKQYDGASVTYDGILLGDDYSSFLQSCDIGLCTQNANAKFNATSFPSKILSYLTNGLKVVSIKIEAIEKSKVANYIFFYEDDNPKCIANTIEKLPLRESFNSRDVIKKLDDEFKVNLNNIICEMR